MLGFLEFYFFIIVFQAGIPVAMFQHSFKHLSVCQYSHSIHIATALKDNLDPRTKVKGLSTLVVPPTCAKLKTAKKAQQSKQSLQPEVEETEEEDLGGE